MTRATLKGEANANYLGVLSNQTQYEDMDSGASMGSV